MPTPAQLLHILSVFGVPRVEKKKENNWYFANTFIRFLTFIHSFMFRDVPFFKMTRRMEPLDSNFENGFVTIYNTLLILNIELCSQLKKK